MNTSGEAADQVMRMMLNGAEVLVKLSGSGAKNAAVICIRLLVSKRKQREPRDLKVCSEAASP